MGYRSSLVTHSKHLLFYIFSWQMLVLTLAALQLPLSIPIVAGVALDVIGWQVVQLIYLTEFGGFLQLPLVRKQEYQLHSYNSQGYSHHHGQSKALNQQETKNKKSDSAEQMLVVLSATAQSLIGQRARKVNMRADRGNWRVARGNTCRHPVQQITGICLEQVA